MNKPSSLLSSVHDFKVFINSYYPLIVIETSEEKRVRKMLSSIALQLGMELKRWTSSTGIKSKLEVSKALNTHKPIELLSYMERREGEFIYLLKDFHHFLEDPVFTRAFREIIYKFSKIRTSIFLTGVNIKLPPEIHNMALFYELKTPSEEELKKLLENMYFSIQEKHKVSYQINPEEEKLLLQALRGMTLNQARQAIAFAFLEDKALTQRGYPSHFKTKS